MNEDQAFWGTAQMMAKNLNLKISVSPEGRMALHHAIAQGEPGRPTDDEVETFRQFLGRNRDRILRANKIDPPDNPYRDDARRLLSWLNEQSARGEFFLTAANGRTIDFQRERAALVRSFREEFGWIGAAWRFKRDCMNAVGWKDANPGPLPEIWQ